MLIFFIKIHHPKCINVHDEVSYVFNENLWIDQLYKIYEFVCREIQSINNSDSSFFELAVSIFKMVNYYFS